MVCGPGVYQKETGYLFYKTVGPILKTIFINLRLTQPAPPDQILRSRVEVVRWDEIILSKV